MNLSKLMEYSRERLNGLHFKDLDTNETYDLEIRHEDGGHNYFTGANSARGIYMSIRPAQRDEHHVSYMFFSGMKKCLKRTARFSRKDLELYSAILKDPAKYSDFITLYEGVLEQNNRQAQTIGAQK